MITEAGALYCGNVSAPAVAEPHPHDMLRARALSGHDAVDMWAVEEIDRLTEALAAARSEAIDNAEDRDGYARSINAKARETAALNEALAAAREQPSPLVALASAIAKGASLAAFVTQGREHDAEVTADRVIVFARRILGAT